jgi:hypothetical protein
LEYYKRLGQENHTEMSNSTWQIKRMCGCAGQVAVFRMKVDIRLMRRLGLPIVII